MILLVNLDSGEVIDADEIKLRERGTPRGFRAVEGISPEEWLNALRSAQGLDPIKIGNQ